MATQESSGAALGDQPISTFGVLTSAPVITLAELSHVSDSYLQTPASSKISSIQSLSPATWQGLATAARLLGSSGTSAKVSMQVVAGKFMGSSFCHELGSGELFAPDSRLYATVKKAEQAEQVQQDLRAALDQSILQQAELSRDLANARATIKRQTCQLDRQAALSFSTFVSIQAAGQHVDGVRAPAWHGIPSSSGPEQNCSLPFLTRDAPSWLQSRIRWHGKQVWKQFSSSLERIFGWYPRQHERSHGSGGGAMSALGMLASHPLDNHGSYSVRAMLTGVLQQLPFSDGTLQGAPSLWRTLRSVIGPYISPQAPHIAIAAFSVGASADQTYRIANSASHMAPHSGRSNVKVRRLVTNKNKLSKMLGGLKDTLAWLVGLAPSGINGAQASLLQVT
eukprot:CAMPEP_0179419100 /NCGR_PEP_ID=MMETSP0799-20121207/8406_1 /TAXON_ID=46947 /ORGANISM="Geminigera cryophila, Strain CCMP2564" /LENGTH=394 /DNA_ID=CAMNT_0021192525 /DNA_START=368 /DNA_END=1548 /DNA_ORIENTATION=-